jgi:hypothetical protein
VIQQRGWQYIKAAFVCLFAIFGLSFLHISIAGHGIDAMAGHGTNNIQCLISCATMLPGDRQDGKLQIERAGIQPDPTPYVSAGILLAFMVATFTMKLLLFSSSWRPPDKVLLYGRYADSL